MTVVASCLRRTAVAENISASMRNSSCLYTEDGAVEVDAQEYYLIPFENKPIHGVNGHRGVLAEFSPVSAQNPLVEALDPAKMDADRHCEWRNVIRAFGRS